MQSVKPMPKTENILNGNMRKLLIKLSLPIMISNLLQAIYNLTDTFWVAKLGSYAIAALTISFPIVFFIIAIGSGLSTGSSILISHAVGKAFKEKKNPQKRADLVLSQTFTLFVITFIVLSVIGFISAPYLAMLMHPTKLVLTKAVIYLRTIFAGLIFVFLYYIFEGALRAMGNTKTPMRFVLVSVIINIILDPLMIFGIGFPKMGVFGAALATVLSRAIIGFIALYQLIKGKYGIRLRWNYLSPNFKVIREILKLGIPTSFAMSSISLGILIFTGIVSHFGTQALAAYGIVTRFFSLARIPSLGISVALSVIIAQNHGAGNTERIFKSIREAFIFGSKIIIAISLVLFIFAKPIVLAFTSEKEVINLGITFLRILSPFFIFMLIRNIFNGFFRGIKRPDISMSINLANSFLFKIPLAYLLAFILHMGLLGIWWSYPAMMTATVLLAYYIFSKIRRRLKREQVNIESIKLEGEEESQILSEE